MSHACTNSVNTKHYKPAPDRLQQMHQHEIVQQHDDERRNSSLRGEVTIADRYEKHRIRFVKMPEKLGAILVGHLVQIITSRHRANLISSDVWAVQSVPYQAGPAAKQFLANEREKRCKGISSNPPQTSGLAQLPWHQKRTVQSDSVSSTESWTP